MEFIASGKVKDVYRYDESCLLFRFSDRVSAFDVKFNEPVPQKGHALCRFAEYWFDALPVKNHFIKRVSDTEIIVKKMKMIPMECVVRGYFYGSLAERCKKGQIPTITDGSYDIAQKLDAPIFDPTTKSEHDIPVNRQQAIDMGLVSEVQFDLLSATSIQIYLQMSSVADSAGFILADLKLEFGFDNAGNIVLGDSIGPDEYRLWPQDGYEAGRTQDSYDKQILRDWLVQNNHAKRFDADRKSGRQPVPPPIPDHIIQKMTDRYVTSYRRLTGRAL